MDEGFHDILNHEVKKGEGKGGKYWEKENIWPAEVKKNREGRYFSRGGEEKWRRKRRTIFKEGK